jgi:hypothetical protein
VDIVDAAELGDEQWDRLCEVATGAWFWHTSAWRDYTLAYRPALQSRSLAFAVVDAGKPVALSPLMVENTPDDGARRFSFGGDACWSPAIMAGAGTSQSEAALRLALAHVDSLAMQHGADSVALRLSPVAAAWRDHLPLLMAATTRSGYADVSLASQVIDLGESADVIRSAMTKGHRADITRGRRLLEVTATTGADAVAGFPDYQAMHALAAGRVTRPEATFSMMRSWLVGGTAALLTATQGDAAVGFTYLIVYGDGAYYASAANHPDHGAEPIGHVLHAGAIDWLRERGVRWYELGLQQFGPLPHQVPSDKELGIARFKRGFGGRAVPLLTREKWYSASAYRRAVESRMERYVAAGWS